MFSDTGNCVLTDHGTEVGRHGKGLHTSQTLAMKHVVDYAQKFDEIRHGIVDVIISQPVRRNNFGVESSPLNSAGAGRAGTSRAWVHSSKQRQAEA